MRQDESNADVIRETLRELLPAVAESLTPPDGGGDVDFDALGITTDELREFALSGLTRRLDMIGAPL